MTCFAKGLIAGQYRFIYHILWYNCAVFELTIVLILEHTYVKVCGDTF